MTQHPVDRTKSAIQDEIDFYAEWLQRETDPIQCVQLRETCIELNQKLISLEVQLYRIG